MTLPGHGILSDASVLGATVDELARQKLLVRALREAFPKDPDEKPWKTVTLASERSVAMLGRPRLDGFKVVEYSFDTREQAEAWCSVATQAKPSVVSVMFEVATGTCFIGHSKAFTKSMAEAYWARYMELRMQDPRRPDEKPGKMWTPADFSFPTPNSTTGGT